jgi:phage repressor protein C with HTH and peptisase S24 domain
LNGKKECTDKFYKLVMQGLSQNEDGAIGVCYLAGAGDPRVSSGEVIISITLPVDFTKPGIIPVMVKGDSMKPVFLDGAIVGVDTSDREYIAGRYYAVWMDDEGAMIKKLSSERDRIFVESMNKDEHSFYVNKSEVRDHFILGRVKWWINQDG